MRYIKYLIGLSAMTLGISIIIKSSIGASPWDSASVGLSETVGFTTGTWTTLTGVGLVILIAIVNRTMPNIMSIVSGFITGVFIDGWLSVIPELPMLVGAIGIIFFAFGISYYTNTKLPPNPIDNFMVGLVEGKGMSFSNAKLVTDAIGLVIGFLVKGPIGIGTVIIFFTVPYLIAFFNKQFKLNQEN